jgi:hypothetical protein
LLAAGCRQIRTYELVLTGRYSCACSLFLGKNTRIHKLTS